MKIRVLTWNLSYAYGRYSEGIINYSQKSHTHFKLGLQSISDCVRKLNVDIALFQEVDFHSKRSFYTDQLGLLSRSTGLLYRDACVSWQNAYVPYPGLNPKHQFGKVKSGGGILSRKPIQPLAQDLLMKPRENSKIYNHFYPYRYLQMVQVMGLRFANLHLEAFSQENRELHLIRLQDRLIDYDLDFAGGDFNGVCTLLPKFQPTYQASFPKSPTFPSEAATEPLDGFVIKKHRFASVSVETIPDAQGSDHLPVLLTLNFENNS